MTERLYGKSHTAKLFDRHDAGLRRLADDLGVVLVDDDTPLSSSDPGPRLTIARSARGPVFANDAPGVAPETEVIQ